MFMIDMHGTRDFATAFISSRTPGDPYWGSCIARPMRSYSRGSTSVVPAADTRPGSLREFAPATDRYPNPKSFGIDQICLGRKTDELHRMSAEEDLRREKRAV